MLAKKKPGKKSLFLVPKNVFYVIFFFSCLKMIFCELMLLELGDLLGLSLLRNFLVRQGQYFLVNISARWLNISILLIWYPILFCLYLSSPISYRKLLVLKTKLWMSPFKWNMSQPSRMSVTGDIKQAYLRHPVDKGRCH